MRILTIIALCTEDENLLKLSMTAVKDSQSQDTIFFDTSAEKFLLEIYKAKSKFTKPYF
jgi:hypothetical protein